MKVRWHPAWIFGLLALLLRVAWIIYRWHSNGPALEYPDEQLHWDLARNLIEQGDLISTDGRLAARMPLYPLFLALFAASSDAGVLLARLAQACCGAATTIIAWHFMRSATNRRGANITAGLICFDPFGVFFTNLLLTEVLFTLLGVSLTACAWRLATSPGRPGWAPLGLAVLGPLCVLTRPSALLWIPALWVLLLFITADRRRTLGQLLIAPVMFVALMLPWGLRNQATLGNPAWLSTNGGVTLYDAQGPQADGNSDQSFLGDMPELEQLDEVTRDHTLRDLALEEMRRDPWRVAALAGRKFLRTWNLVPNVSEHSHGASAVASAVYTAAVLLGALIGLIRALAARVRPHQLMFWRLSPGTRSLHALLWLPVIYFALLHCIYIGSLRYRVPLMPFLAAAAATAILTPAPRRV